MCLILILSWSRRTETAKPRKAFKIINLLCFMSRLRIRIIIKNHCYITIPFPDLFTQQEFLLLLPYTSICPWKITCASGNALLKTNLPTFDRTGGLIDMGNTTPNWFHQMPNGTEGVFDKALEEWNGDGQGHLVWVIAQSLHGSYFKYILNVTGEHQTPDTLINRLHHILICIQTLELSSVHSF